MAHDDVAVVDQPQLLSNIVGLGREAGDQVGADRDVRRARLQPRHRRDGVGAAWRRFIRLRIMSSPACKLRWRCGMKPRLAGRDVEQPVVDLDAVERRQAQPRQLRHVLQDAARPAGPSVGGPGRSAP